MDLPPDLFNSEIIQKAIKQGKKPLAVLLCQHVALKGGKVRAEKLSAKKLKEIAKKAATARWAKKIILHNYTFTHQISFNFHFNLASYKLILQTTTHHNISPLQLMMCIC